MENGVRKMENGARKMENGAGKTGSAGKLNVQILRHRDVHHPWYGIFTKHLRRPQGKVNGCTHWFFHHQNLSFSSLCKILK